MPSKKALIYIVTCVVTLIILYALYYYYESTYVERTFGLIQRKNVPLKIRDNLNQNPSESPTVTHIPNMPIMPLEFDARKRWPGLITDSINQAKCGSCWAFAIATACSDRMRIADPTNKDLTKIIKYYDAQLDIYYETLNNFSPWVLAACNLCKNHPFHSEIRAYGFCQNKACDGAILQMGMQYIKEYGLITADCDPRHTDCLMDKKNCDYQCYYPPYCKVYKPTLIHRLDEDYSSEIGVEKGGIIEYKVCTNGPIITGFAVYKSFMSFFDNVSNSKKVYTPHVKDTFKNDYQIGGHAVVILGWGVLDGEHYWLARNSWGTQWADEGVFRISKGINFCGIIEDCWSAHWD